MSMRQKRLQRRILSVIRGWNDAHGIPLQNLIEGMDISDDYNLTLHVCPSRPHCPCCLYDLLALRESLLNTKGVVGVRLEIVGIPDASRWTRTLNE